jgi:hypothetical protein
MKTQATGKRRIVSILLSTAFLLGISGCGTDSTVDGLSLKEYLTENGLDDYISIKFDPNDIKNYTKAKVYEAEYWDFDEDAVKTALMQYSPIYEDINEVASIYTSDNGTADDCLYFYNKEESGDPKDNAKGGFEYFHHFNQQFDLQNYYSIYPKEILMGTNYDPYKLAANPKSKKDLEFMSYKSAMEEVEKVFDSLGFPEYQCQEVKALDLDALTRSYRYSEELNLKNPDFTVPVQPIKENETYVLQYRQMIDGIPVANYLGYQNPDSTCRRSTISVGYTKDGISNLYVNGLLNVGKGRTTEIIDASKATSIAVDYFKDYYPEKYGLESFELIYHPFIDKETGTLNLIPFWLIRVSEPFTVDLMAPIDQSTSYHTLSYRYLFINAVNGKLSTEYPEQ